MNILQSGGNAVDAAVAAAFTEGVVEPCHNGIAGYGGCMVIYLAHQQKVVAIDYNTVAPAAASDQMFTIEKTDTPAGYQVPGRVNLHGPLAIGVSGVVAGLCLALERFGSMPLGEVIRPAIRSARYGYVPNTANRGAMAGNAERWLQDFPETARVFLKNGRAPKPGERLTNADLARTLETVAEGGFAAFYQGSIAQTIVDYIQECGGCLSVEDFQRYTPRVLEPYEINYRGYRIYTAPLGAGGLTTLQMLRLIESYDVGSTSLVERTHLLAEAMKIGWQERLSRFGDPDFVEIDISKELSDSFVAKFAPELKEGSEIAEAG